MLKHIGEWFGIFMIIFGVNAAFNSKYGVLYPRRSVLIGTTIALVGLTIVYFVE